jgi:K+-sensing histidine kinase KdpD
LLGQLALAASSVSDAHTLTNEAARARELAEVDRLRSALLAAVGHDLRTPLSSVKAAVTTLRDTDLGLGEAERAELLATIEGSTDRLTDLIANLLDLSRLQAGALSVRLEAVPPDEVVAQALLGRHLDQVANDVPDDLPPVVADRGLLERVLANLVDNATRHTPQGSPVVIEGSQDADRVELRVVDHGPGIAEESWQQVFAPFQRLDDHSGAGIGLGLAIARGFTEAMGGTVTPRRTPGGGLTMAVCLSVAPEPRYGARAPADTRPRSEPRLTYDERGAT